MLSAASHWSVYMDCRNHQVHWYSRFIDASPFHIVAIQLIQYDTAMPSQRISAFFCKSSQQSQSNYLTGWDNAIQTVHETRLTSLTKDITEYWDFLISDWMITLYTKWNMMKSIGRVNKHWRHSWMKCFTLHIAITGEPLLWVLCLGQAWMLHRWSGRKNTGVGVHLFLQPKKLHDDFTQLVGKGGYVWKIVELCNSFFLLYFCCSCFDFHFKDFEDAKKIQKNRTFSSDYIVHYKGVTFMERMQVYQAC